MSNEFDPLKGRDEYNRKRKNEVDRLHGQTAQSSGWVDYGDNYKGKWKDYGDNYKGKWKDYGDNYKGNWEDQGDGAWFPEDAYEIKAYGRKGWKDLQDFEQAMYENKMMREYDKEWWNPTISPAEDAWYEEIKTKSHDEEGNNLWEKERLKNLKHEKLRQIIRDKRKARTRFHTRLPKAEYTTLKHEYESNGMGTLELRLGSNRTLVWLRVMSDDFRSLNNPEYDRLRKESEEGYHISIAKPSTLYKNGLAQRKFGEFIRKYFGNGIRGRNTIHHTFNKVRVAPSSVIEFEPTNEFEKDLYELTQIATGKEGYPHISMD